MTAPVFSCPLCHRGGSIPQDKSQVWGPCSCGENLLVIHEQKVAQAKLKCPACKKQHKIKGLPLHKSLSCSCGFRFYATLAKLESVISTKHKVTSNALQKKPRPKVMQAKRSLKTREMSSRSDSAFSVALVWVACAVCAMGLGYGSIVVMRGSRTGLMELNIAKNISQNMPSRDDSSGFHTGTIRSMEKAESGYVMKGDEFSPDGHSDLVRDIYLAMQNIGLER